jgi:hypothetical protein
MRYWKIVLSLLLVFAAGAVTGSVVTHQAIKRGVEHALNFERWKSGVMGVLQSKLKLSEEQHHKIEALVDAKGRDIRAAFSRAFDESGHDLVRLQVQIDQELTPNQRVVHAQMKRDFRAELKKRFNFNLPEE